MEHALELKGSWWLPGSARNKLPGTLTYSQADGAILEIVGVFKRERFTQVEHPTIILGISQQGNPITLYKCLTTKLNDPLTGLGVGESRYHAHYMFEGAHFLSEEKIKFHQVQASFTDLDSWVDIFGFNIERDKIGEKYLSKISFELPDTRLFNVDNVFDVGVGFSSSGPNVAQIQTEVKIIQRAYILVKSKKGDISFDALFQQFHRFTYLLQFGVQRIPYPLAVVGFSKKRSEKLDGKKTFYPPINIYYSPIEPITSQKDRSPFEMLFTFLDLTEEQISNWFLGFDKYQRIINLYRTLFYSNRLFMETKFLNIAQALESLHSIQFGSQDLSPDVFSERRKRVLQVVPSDLAEWVGNALNNANFKSFRFRILDLLTDKKKFMNLLVDDMDLFSKRVRDTRNEFVHNTKQKLTFERGIELCSAINVLTVLFETYLLEIIGFSDEKIQELIDPKIKSQQTGWKHARTKRP